MKVCAFCGHSNFSVNDEIKKGFDDLIERLICDGVDVFYSGGYGRFDSFVVREIYKYKEKYPHIKNYIVVPYLTQSHLQRYEFLVSDGVAETLYPFVDRVMPKFAILKRNEWMVDSADIVVGYIDVGLGGAYNTYNYALSRGKYAINLGKKTDFD